MKTSSKFIILAVMVFFIPALAFCAEIMEDDPVVITPVPKKTSATAAAVTVKPAPAAVTVKPTPAAAVKLLPTQEPTAKKPEISPEVIAELKIKLEELSKITVVLKDEIKALEEKNIETAGAAKDLELYKKNLDDIQTRHEEDSKKVAELEKGLNSIQDAVKGKIDKMSSWDDILYVLKKEISNNELEIARLKKEINGLKKQYGGESENIFDTIAQWPYSGFVALIISIAAFITVVTKP